MLRYTVNQNVDNPYQAPATAPVLPEGTLFYNSAPEQVAEALNAYFLKNRYRLESGSKMQGVYGTGNDILRILLGAFAKRFKFRFAISPQPNGTALVVEKGMSGAMGGAIGYMRMNKEYTRVLGELRGLLG